MGVNDEEREEKIIIMIITTTIIIIKRNDWKRKKERTNEERSECDENVWNESFGNSIKSYISFTRKNHEV